MKEAFQLLNIIIFSCFVNFSIDLLKLDRYMALGHFRVAPNLRDKLMLKAKNYNNKKLLEKTKRKKLKEKLIDKNAKEEQTKKAI